MKKDAGIHLTKLHVDGKMAENNLLLQLQADISGIPICESLISIIGKLKQELKHKTFSKVRSKIHDTTSLGCAIAAGLAEGINLTDLSPQNHAYTVKIHHDTYLPTTTEGDRKPRHKKWKMALERSMGWAMIQHDTTMTGKFTNFTCSTFIDIEQT